MSNVLVELADKLGVLEALKHKLFKDHSAEYEELVRALNSFAASFHLVDGLLTRFLSLSPMSNREQTLQTAREFLLQAEGGALMTQAHEVRGHCNQLRDLYDRKLNNVFEQNLSLDEITEVRTAFDCVKRFHDDTLQDLEGLLGWLAEIASRVCRKSILGTSKELTS